MNYSNLCRTYKEVIFAINQLPEELSFSLESTPLAKGGGKIIYESDEMHDIEVLITTNELGVCKYATIRNTPRKLIAEWTPTRMNGSYVIRVESDGTAFILKNSLDNPTINFTVNNLESINVTATWNLTNLGDFTVTKDPSLNIDIEFMIGEWIATLDAQPVANHLSASW